MCSKKLILTDFCDDLLCQIFDHLSVKDVLAIQTVNKDFHRCARKWLSTVDEVVIIEDCIYLEKTFSNGTGKFSSTSSSFELDSQLGQVLLSMLDVCTGIKIVRFVDDSITAAQLIQAISRCPNINRFSSELAKVSYDDDEWTRLVQLVKHCDIRLDVFYFEPNTVVRIDQLEQLFTQATSIKSVAYFDAPEAVLKTIDLLDQSTTVTVDDIFHLKPVDGHIRQLIAQRVNDLTISSKKFKALSIRRFENLSELNISSINEVDALIFQKFKFCRLEVLTLQEEENCPLISNFFAAVDRLDQLKRLELISDGSIQLSEVLAKTPNITELTIRWRDFSSIKISAFEELFKFLSSQTSATRLQTVAVSLLVTQLAASGYCRLTDCLVRFGRRKPDIELNLHFWDNNF